jgi:WD40 repeat protein
MHPLRIPVTTLAAFVFQVSPASAGICLRQGNDRFLKDGSAVYLLQVTTHSTSQNNILLWRYRDLKQFASLTGHSSPVLYMTMSPDGREVMTGGSDECLQLWRVFGKSTSQKVSALFIHWGRQ